MKATKKGTMVTKSTMPPPDSIQSRFLSFFIFSAFLVNNLLGGVYVLALV